MKINVAYQPSTHRVKLWWFTSLQGGVDGIAEWETSIPVEHQNSVDHLGTTDGQTYTVYPWRTA